MARALVPAFTAAFIAVLSTTPGASASGLPVSPYVNVWIESWVGTTAQVCAEGAVNNGMPPWNVEWRFAVAAVRSDGTTAAPPPVTGSGQFFTPPCEYVSTTATPNGVLTAQVTVVAVVVPDLTGTDVAGSAGLAAVWTPDDPTPDAFIYTTPG